MNKFNGGIKSGKKCIGYKNKYPPHLLMKYLSSILLIDPKRVAVSMVFFNHPYSSNIMPFLPKAIVYP